LSQLWAVAFISLSEMAAAAVPLVASNPIGWGIAAATAAVTGVIIIANAVRDSPAPASGGGTERAGGGAGTGGDGGDGGRGRSPIPPAKRDYSPTRKEAFDKAKQAGHKLAPRGPEDHGHGPHFHPNVKDALKKHDHYYFPKRFH
jgi:hypothetical protein